MDSESEPCGTLVSPLSVTLPQEDAAMRVASMSVSSLVGCFMAVPFQK